MTATEIRVAEFTKLYSSPVFIQGIKQPTLHHLERPLDARVNGVLMRLPVGTVIVVLGGGSAGLAGSVPDEFLLTGLDGQTYRASRGMELQTAE